jgi:hypothetical protein
MKNAIFAQNQNLLNVLIAVVFADQPQKKHNFALCAQGYS